MNPAWNKAEKIKFGLFYSTENGQQNKVIQPQITDKNVTNII